MSLVRGTGSPQTNCLLNKFEREKKKKCIIHKLYPEYSIVTVNLIKKKKKHNLRLNLLVGFHYQVKGYCIGSARRITIQRLVPGEKPCPSTIP